MDSGDQEVESVQVLNSSKLYKLVVNPPLIVQNALYLHHLLQNSNDTGFCTLSVASLTLNEDM